MAGYNGFSMSNNAAEAYKNGEKPLSRWSKADIIKAIMESGITLKCSIDKLQSAPVKVLKEVCLYNSSWHHTSKHYNKTDFYELSIESVSELTDEKLDEYISTYKNEKSDTVEEKWECAFLEWSGTRNYPKATEYIEEGTIKGDWFYRKNGSRKKISSNGFRRIRKCE